MEVHPNILPNIADDKTRFIHFSYEDYSGKDYDNRKGENAEGSFLTQQDYLFISHSNHQSNKEWNETPLHSLNLENRVISHLLECGISTVADLSQKTMRELLTIPGIQKREIIQIIRALLDKK